MRTLHLFLLSLASLLAASCSSEEDFPAAKQGKPIEFSTYIQNHSRAVGKTAFEDGDQIGLYACRTTGDYTNTFTSNFMNNVAVTKEATGWTYSPPAVWPNDENEHISFVAFYPKSATTSSTGLTYDFTMSSDLQNQIDPLWCTIKDAHINDRNGTAINGNETAAAFEATSGSVPLKFQHILSKVRIKIKLNNDYPGITAKLNSMSVEGVSLSGTFTTATDLSSGSWNANETKGRIPILQTTNEGKVLSTDDLSLGEILVVPQSLTGSTNTSLNICYTHTLAEGGEKTISKTIYLGDSWEYNKVYNYLVKVSLDINTITVSTEIENWDDEVQPEIGSTTDAPEPIDLGLSVKWASCDYGTISPYVAGPTFPYEFYNMTFDSTWGANWSVPSREQWTELFDRCTMTETNVNGRNGYLFTANNGNSIFFASNYYWTSYNLFTYIGSGHYASDYYYAQPQSCSFIYYINVMLTIVYFDLRAV